MQQMIFQEKYPVFYLEIDKSETTFERVSDIIAYFKTRIDEHEIARFIATFDHYAHTRALPNGEISAKILDAQCIIFCFGVKLPTPRVMSVRPRSIGVCELEDRFAIDFLEAPMPQGNLAMESWAKGLRNQVTSLSF